MAAPLGSLSKVPSFSRLSSIPTYSALPQRTPLLSLHENYGYSQQPLSPVSSALVSYIPTYAHPPLTDPLPSIQIAAPRTQDPSSLRARFFSKFFPKPQAQPQKKAHEQLPTGERLESLKCIFGVPKEIPTTIVDIALNVSPAVNVGKIKPWGLIAQGLGLSMAKLQFENLKELSLEKRYQLAAELRNYIGPEYEYECILFIREMLTY